MGVHGRINHSVVFITEKVAGVIVKVILAHLDMVEVHEAACFVLITLVATAANAELSHHNGLLTLSLELAFQKHTDVAGFNILTL